MKKRENVDIRHPYQAWIQGLEMTRNKKASDQPETEKKNASGTGKAAAGSEESAQAADDGEGRSAGRTQEKTGGSETRIAAGRARMFTVRTTERTQFVDITEQVRQIAAQSGVTNGLCTVFVPHTTAAVTINENADPDVVSDFVREIERIVPWENHYLHAEGNSSAHIKSSIIGCSEQVIIDGGQLLLGTWQGIYLAEFDGPRMRKVYVSVIG